MSREVRIRLVGRDAQLGQVPAADVGRLLLGLERSAARAAAVVAGRRRRPGRRPASIETAVRFRLKAIESGSVVGVLEAPEVEASEEAFELGDAQLGEVAISRTIAALNGEESDAWLAASLVQFADELGIGSRYEAIEVEQEWQGSPMKGKLTSSIRDRLEVAAGWPEPAKRQDTLVGVLVEADFEHMTARLRTMPGERVDVTFEEPLAEDIKHALREQASLKGHVFYDPETTRAVRVELQDVALATQLVLSDAEAFWERPSVEELRRRQGAEQVDDLSRLEDSEASTEEVDAILAALEL